MRAGTVKLIGIVCVALTVLITLIAFVPTYTLSSETSANAEYNYEKIKTESDVVSFLSQFGWTVDPSPVEVKTVTIPAELDKIFAAYNTNDDHLLLNNDCFRDPDVYYRFLQDILAQRSMSGFVDQNVQLTRDSRILTLSTCNAYDDQRYLVQCLLIDPETGNGFE
jgi:hypothetical protein